MKTNVKILPVLLAAAALSGCQSIYDSYGNGGSARSQRDQARLREQSERLQLQQNTDYALSAARDAEARMQQLELRLERLEAASRAASSYASLDDIDQLRRENAELRTSLADARASQEQMRAEIIGNVQTLFKEQQKRAATTAAPASSKAQSGYEHKVGAGQTLSAIAKAYGVSVQKIKDANGLKGDVIRVGQVLFIPD